MRRMMPSNISPICQFWDTTALFSPVKVHQKVRKFATKFCVAGGGSGDYYELCPLIHFDGMPQEGHNAYSCTEMCEMSPTVLSVFSISPYLRIFTSTTSAQTS